MSPRGAPHETNGLQCFIESITSDITMFEGLQPASASTPHHLPGLPNETPASGVTQGMAHKGAHGQGQSAGKGQEHDMNLTPIVLAAALILGGCSAKPLSSEKTDNPEVRADYLATIDGCRLWRVNTGNRYVFLARCTDRNTTSTQWEESCGKACTRHEMVLTEGDRE
jgi:hypothetical protein